MYHYVQECNSILPNFRYLGIQNFIKQLEFFKEKFGFISRNDWDNIVSKKDTIKNKTGVLLTFDDSLSCHYEFVFKILKELELWGIFYVPTLPYTQNEMLDVHKIHLLIGKINAIKLLDKCHELITDDMIPYSKQEEFSNLTYRNQDNQKGESEFKRILNYFIDEKYKSNLIDEISKIYKIKYSADVFYIHPKNIKKMEDSGMIIGSHGESHPVMSKLNKSSQKQQIIRSFDYLHSICKMEHKSYCHPYGGFHSFDNKTIEILNENKVQYSFNVESRDLEENDLLKKRHLLPRYDCNEFQFGKSS